MGVVTYAMGNIKYVKWKSSSEKQVAFQKIILALNLANQGTPTAI